VIAIVRKSEINDYLFCFSLTYSYLCTRKRAKLGGTSSIGASSIAFDLHELCTEISLKYVFVMCMYNISLKDELLSETRRSFDSEAAMDTWLQQQVEALLVAYNASQQAARRKARLAIAAMRRQSEENGNAAMTLDDINNEIQQARKARKAAV